MVFMFLDDACTFAKYSPVLGNGICNVAVEFDFPSPFTFSAP